MLRPHPPPSPPVSPRAARVQAVARPHRGPRLPPQPRLAERCRDLPFIPAQPCPGTHCMAASATFMSSAPTTGSCSSGSRSTAQRGQCACNPHVLERELLQVLSSSVLCPNYLLKCLARIERILFCESVLRFIQELVICTERMIYHVDLYFLCVKKVI